MTDEEKYQEALKTLLRMGEDRAAIKEVSRPNMTLRDWFAGQALIGLSRNPGGYEWKAQEAYAMADALLLVRTPRGDGKP